MNREPKSTFIGGSSTSKGSLKMLPGKTLVIGPSRSGKSYYSSALRSAGLNVIDADKDTELIKWRNDKSGDPVKKPKHTDESWLSCNHFVLKVKELENFLALQGDVIIFAHCWNIMDVIDLFDRTAFMSLRPEELERRLQIDRPDHVGIGSNTELDFFRQRHQERTKQARELHIPLIDATLSPSEFYRQLRLVTASATR